jgi:serine/threonine-protein kinase RsbW
MDLAGSVARLMGFPSERVDDIRTVVLEATLNAIEHGNGLDAAKPVRIVLTATSDGLEIMVRDRARRPFVLPAVPSLEAQIAGQAPRRGWGTFLMRSLVDDLEVASSPTGNLVRMVVHWQTPSPRPVAGPG